MADSMEQIAQEQDRLVDHGVVATQPTEGLATTTTPTEGSAPDPVDLEQGIVDETASTSSPVKHLYPTNIKSFDLQDVLREPCTETMHDEGEQEIAKEHRSIQGRFSKSFDFADLIASVTDSLQNDTHKNVQEDLRVLSAKSFDSGSSNQALQDDTESLYSDEDEEYDIEENRPTSVPPVATKTPSRLRLVDDFVRRKLQYVYVFATLYVAPVSAALYLPLGTVSALYFLSIGCVAFVNLWMILETCAAVLYTRQMRKLHQRQTPLEGERRLAAVIAAYLPNELAVLPETVRAIARQIEHLPPGTTLDIVLAHNGGSSQQRASLLQDLFQMEASIPATVQVLELHVASSKSKAENVNGALDYLHHRQRDYTQVAMYDADHRPIPQAFRYALETLQAQKANMVMGRCCVAQGFTFVAIEFDILYAVSHAGGRLLRGFGFFGGSNGYWDYQTLRETGMDEGMLTEDVDASFRAQAAGHGMTYDPTIVSFEEAPPTLLALFKQRLRWTQGWSEVTIRQRNLWWRNKSLSLWTRFCILLLLPFREVYAYLSSFTVPIAVVWLTRACGAACIDLRLIGFLGFCSLVPWFMTLVAWTLTESHRDLCHYVGFCLWSYVYELIKIHVTVLGHARNALGLNAWVVTQRRQTPVQQQTDSRVELRRNPAVVEPRVFPGTWDARGHMEQDPSSSSSTDESSLDPW